MLMIGFTNVYYTLWDVTTENQYYTAGNGQVCLTGTIQYFNYIKNISIDFAKVREQYPTLEFSDELRGQTTSFEKFGKEELAPELFTYGKYAGKFVSEILLIDFQYLVWVSQNWTNKTAQLIAELPEVVAYIEKQTAEELARVSAFEKAVEGTNFVEFYKNAQHNHFIFDDENGKEIEIEGYFIKGTIGYCNDLYIKVEVKHIGGKYPYNMSLINGKFVKTKGKTFELNLKILHTQNCKYNVFQIAEIV